MKISNTRTLLLATTTALAVALPASAAAAWSDPRYQKLTECMKARGASPEQAKCLEQWKAMPKPAPVLVPAMPAAAPASAQPAAAPVPADIKQAATQLGVNGSHVGRVKSIDVSGKDPQTAMLMVQQHRAALIEDTMEYWLRAFERRNKDIGEVNHLIDTLKKLRPPGSDAGRWANLGASQAEGRQVYKRLQAAGVAIPMSGPEIVDEPGTGIYDAQQRTFDRWIQVLNGKIGGINGQQQAEVQSSLSLAAKRNEAFNLLSSYIKKMADSGATTIGNMR